MDRLVRMGSFTVLEPFSLEYKIYEGVYAHRKGIKMEDFNIKQTYQVNLSLEEKVKCLEEILNKLKKVLYVYDKSLEPNSEYNYKVYCGGVLIYVSSSNLLFNGELVNIVININAILTNEFSKTQIKRIVFETKNFTEFLLSKYKKELDKLYKTEE